MKGFSGALRESNQFANGACDRVNIQHQLESGAISRLDQIDMFAPGTKLSKPGNIDYIDSKGV